MNEDAAAQYREWLGGLGVDPAETRDTVDPEAAFAAGWAAGVELAEHEAVHYGNIMDCRYCQAGR